jgi:hypothetical protein
MLQDVYAQHRPDSRRSPRAPEASSQASAFARLGNRLVSSLNAEQLLNYGNHLSDYNVLRITDRISA